MKQHRRFLIYEIVGRPIQSEKKEEVKGPLATFVFIGNTKPYNVQHNTYNIDVFGRLIHGISVYEAKHISILIYSSSPSRSLNYVMIWKRFIFVYPRSSVRIRINHNKRNVGVESILDQKRHFNAVKVFTPGNNSSWNEAWYLHSFWRQKTQIKHRAVQMNQIFIFITRPMQYYIRTVMTIH